MSNAVSQALTWGVRTLIAIVGLVTVLLALTGCTLEQSLGSDDPTESTMPGEALVASGVAQIEYRLYQALPDFDDSTFTSTDPQRISDLVDLLNENGVVGGFEPPANASPCPPGSGSGFVAYTLTSGERVSISLGACGDDRPDYMDDLWSLARGWHSEDAAPGN